MKDRLIIFNNKFFLELNYFKGLGGSELESDLEGFRFRLLQLIGIGLVESHYLQ